MKKPPFYKSVLYTIKGLVWILRNERNYQIEIFGLLINLMLIVFLNLSATDTAIILVVSFLVLIAECLNTCIEKICDFIQPGYDKKIGIIKDIAGGSVLLSVILAIIIALIIYPKYIF